MTPGQKIALRLSAVRSRLNAISALEGDGFTDEIRNEATALQTEFADLEVRAQAAIVAGSADETRIAAEFGEDPEGRELRGLVGRASVGEIFTAALEHRATAGATLELQSHYRLGANQVPLAMLRDPEHRAVTPGPGNVGQTQSAIIPAVFPDSVAAFLGIDMPTVGVGEATFPVLATSAVVGVPDENAVPSGTGIDSEGATTGSFSAEVLSPSRLQAAFFYSREDRARFAGMDEALRSNLSDALMDRLDQQILNGGEGLLNGTNLANNNVSAEDDFESYLSHFGWARVDGKYASGVGDLRIVMGSATYAHAGETYAGTATNKGDLSSVEKLMDITGGVKVSAHVPAVSGNKQNAVVRLGMRRDMVAPIWEGITLIPDEITKASSGQIVVTAVMLHAIKILRAAGFRKQQSQHA